jgi:allantoinase
MRMERRELVTLLGSATALFAVHLPSTILAQDGADWVTGFPREPVHVADWPAGRKVAASFVLDVETRVRPRPARPFGN